MTLRTSPQSSAATTARSTSQQPDQQDATTPQLCLSPTTSSAQYESKTPLCVKPFDHWTPLGGGTARNIFRCFKIRATEEEAFFTHWAKRQLTSGNFARDDTGTLVFRVSSADISDLADLGIGPSNVSKSSYQWLQVYDAEGSSWLTQSGRIGVGIFAMRSYDPNGRLLIGK